MIPFPYLSAHQTGSRYTVAPAVLDTDDDWLVLVEDLAATVKALNCRPDWAAPLDYSDLAYKVEEGEWSFVSYRNGDTNLVITDDRTMYLRGVAATLLAQKLNLKTKEERVELFRTVKFGNEHKGRLP